MPKPQIVTIFGGAGFVGRYVTRRMAQAGWRVRVATRHINDANFTRLYGVVGQVEPVFCNIRDDASVRHVTSSADAVVNCVGILEEGNRNTFENIQAAGASRIARMAAEEGVGRLVHVSAIGADRGRSSRYAQTKAIGESETQKHFPGAVILRPSIIFGTEDKFFNRFAAMARMTPVLPIVGGGTRLQPVYVDDVAAAAEIGALGRAAPGIYELGGPDTGTFREWMEEMLDITHRRRLIVSIPFWIAGLMGRAFGLVKWATFGILSGPITADQVRQLRHDNVVGSDARSFDDLGIEPVAARAVLPEYLWRFRPSGQYDEIKASADNLRTLR